MPWAPHPDAKSSNPTLDLVSDALDPVLVPFGFAPGQAGAAGGRGQVIFCRGDVDSADGACVDLVVYLEEAPDWHVVDVRYYGLSADQWHVDLDRDATLLDQLSGLARSLPTQFV